MSIEETLIKCLSSEPKHIPSWYRYDKEGSRLNDECLENSDLYYFHRFEMELLKTIIQDGNIPLDKFRVLVDLGSGNAAKTKLFLDKFQNAENPKTYIPVDISSDYLNEIALQIQNSYGGTLKVCPIGKEYLSAVEDIRNQDFDDGKLFLWFGSIQSLPYEDQIMYLSTISKSLKQSDKLLATLDITDSSKKEQIENAYSNEYCDALNLNSIVRLNRECSGNVDPSCFDFRSDFVANKSEDRCSYVTVWLQAKENCEFTLNKLNLTLKFEKDEKLYLHGGDGLSCKYSLSQIRTLMRTSGLDITDIWTNEHVAVLLMRSQKI